MKQTYFKVWKRTILSLGITSLIFSACKKSNDNSSIPAGMSLTMSGKSWTAATTAGAYSGGYLMLTGVQTDNTDLTITLESGLKVGKADDYSNSNVYFGKANGDTYSSGSLFGSHGSLTLNSWDSAGKRVTGTFDGVFYSPQNAKDSVVVTGGKFNCTYTLAP